MVEEIGDHIKRVFRSQTRFLVGLIMAWAAILGMLVRTCR